jgi:hypothetical protein
MTAGWRDTLRSFLSLDTDRDADPKSSVVLRICSQLYHILDYGVYATGASSSAGWASCAWNHRHGVDVAPCSDAEPSQKQANDT